jgi:hypothetical protein
MTNRFEHLKSKNQNKPRSLDEFIDDANKEPTAKIAKKRPLKANILLSIAGRGSMDEYSKPSLIYIKRDIEEDIRKHCLGSKQAIINYLLRRALDDLKERGEFMLEDQV